MSQSSVENIESKKSENKQQEPFIWPKDNLFPEDNWWLIIMGILSVLLIVGYIVAYVIKFTS